MSASLRPQDFVAIGRTAEEVAAPRKEPALYDVEAVRSEFPALHQAVHGHALAYLDNAATAQKPRAVLEAMRRFHEEDCSNVHRAVHLLSERATAAYEGARETVRRFVNGASVSEVIFTRGTTESINLVAHSFARQRLRAGDEILVTHLEHHSNIVPWQLACEATGAVLKVAPIDERGAVSIEEFERALSPRMRLVAIAHVSNALGTINPVQEMTALAHARGAHVLVDGAQAVPHLRVDVRELGCDFYAFSSHKLYGPTGIGVLWGREELLDAMPPWQGGGDMISSVTFEKTTWNKLPYKFEAGTPHVAGAYGLAAAIDYVSQIGLDRIAAHEHALLEAANAALSEIRCVRLVGTAPQKAAVVSFVMEGIHPHDVGTVLDSRGIAVRTGHHCAEPVMRFMRVAATTRASFGLYNTLGEVERLAEGLHEVRRFFLPHHS